MSLGLRLRDLYSGYRPFSDESAIIPTVERSGHFDPEQENIGEAKKIQLLSTSKQRTYLVGTGKRVYKVSDDRRSERPKVVWSREIDDLLEDQ